MGYRWKDGEALAAWKARQRHETVRLIRAGQVRPRPDICEKCGRTPGRDRFRRPLVQMHHPDYERPELIEWLCPSCHRRAPHRISGIVTWDDIAQWEREKRAS